MHSNFVMIFSPVTLKLKAEILVKMNFLQIELHRKEIDMHRNTLENVKEWKCHLCADKVVGICQITKLICGSNANVALQDIVVIV